MIDQSINQPINQLINCAKRGRVWLVEISKIGGKLVLTKIFVLVSKNNLPIFVWLMVQYSNKAQFHNINNDDEDDILSHLSLAMFKGHRNRGLAKKTVLI